MILPKNTVVLDVSDQYGNSVKGLELILRGPLSYNVEFQSGSTTMILFAIEPGDYRIHLRNVPGGYDCTKLESHLTLEPGGKVKAEFECTKEID